jgi:hypothetical protein
MMKSRAILAILVVTSVGFVSMACSGEGRNQAEVDVVSAITTLDNAGLHDIDESINESQEVPADARTTALRMEAVTRLADWPEEFEDAAGKLASTFSELGTVLDSDSPDLARAGELAKRAHDEQHDLSGEVWAWLQEEAGIEVERTGSD